MTGRGDPRPPPPPPSRGRGVVPIGRGRARPTLPPIPGAGVSPVGPPTGPPTGPRSRLPPPSFPPSAPRPGFYTSSRVGSGSSPSTGPSLVSAIPKAVTPTPERPARPPALADVSRGMTEVSLAEADSSEDTSSIDTRGRALAPELYRGTQGKPINLSANYLKLMVEEGKGVFEYEVRFSPNVDNRDQRFRLVNQQREVIGGVKVFDGTKLFLPKMLNEKSKTVQSVHTETGDKVNVTFNYLRQGRIGDRDVIQLYNILFGRIMKTLKFTQHNRKYYNAAAAHHIKEYSLSVWPGYVTAVDEYEGGLLLQLDVSHRVLRSETVRDFLGNMRKRGITDIKSEAEKALLGTSVLTRYNNKSYKVDDIDFNSSPKDSFTNEKGEQLTYIDYYKRQYGIEIRDPDQPMLINRPKKKAVGEENVEKLICLVPELCLLTGMTDTMRADFRIMKEVSNFTRLNPAKRQEAIKKFVDSVNGNDAAKSHLSDWGLKLSTITLAMEGRHLQPEMLFFGNNRKESAGLKADWGRAATNNPVLTSIPLSKWAIFFMNRNSKEVQEFCKVMQQQGPKMGINIANPKVVALPNDRTETYLKAIRDVIDPTVQLVLTVVPQQKADRYSAIKKLCCMEKPIASQVVCVRTINNPKKLSSVAQKIALQINCKLGGELWACQTPFQDLMVVGIDVFHDKSHKRGSIAGVVASVNQNLSRYYSTVAIQKSGQEIIDALKVAFMEALVQYYETNNKWPKDIVVFRDGVSDGQMDVVEKHEAEQFIRTFTHVAGSGSGGASGSDTSASSLQKKLAGMVPQDYKPGFSFIIVQKRINTRLFATRGAGQYDNPPAGTVLDHTVTRYKFKDFFLIPQAVSQGTVTPTHFVVIKESKALPADAIQRLAYKLTHMYYNWPGTVRVPAPCQYAHKLVDLVGEHLHSQPSPDLNHKLYYL